ncbi:(Fe-S)-binding protein [Bradyrhizobium sp. UNPF46]|nr:(Fe-S)-binding protein [Bradyrhizobium sp. UNPF46]
MTAAYGGYLKQESPGENVELTHVEKGSLGGELLRRYWQPIALTSEVGDVPLGFRMFGEDLVVFRTTQGEYGILDRHCSHRGTSLEFGLPTEDGLRCCYHGWLFGVDGRVLETPGDPPGSALKDRLFHGAYPVKEYKGLIFGYFGPPSSMPEFPVYDSYDYPDDKLVPYCITYPCNWLQVQENVMDPAHAVFLHTRVTFSHFSDTWGELPVMDFVETPTGMIYVTTRRWKDKVWVRSNDIIMPNLAQVGHIWEDGQDAKQFGRVGITRWTTPIDNTTCKVIGWRHFHSEVNPRGIGKEEDCGLEKVDFYGQGMGQSFEERQRLPGDYDAIVSQRPIAQHALEHLTYCDKGVVMLRKLLRRDIRRVAAGEEVPTSTLRSNGVIPTYCHDTVLSIPSIAGTDDLELQEEVGRRVTEIVVEGEHHTAENRLAIVRDLLMEYERSVVAQAAA